MKTDDIKDVLDVMTFFPAVLKPRQTGNLEYWELGFIAMKIDIGAIGEIASNHFGEKVYKAKMENIKSDNKGNAWNATFDVLVTWSRKTRNNRQVQYFIFFVKGLFTRNFSVKVGHCTDGGGPFEGQSGCRTHSVRQRTRHY